MKCSACSGTLYVNPIPGFSQVHECRKCHGIQGTCYRGDSYKLVSPRWAEGEVPQDRLQYFDLTILGSDGVSRFHGFRDKETTRVVQVG